MARRARRRGHRDRHGTATVHRTGRYTFEVASGTRAGLTHTQDVLHLKCSCEAGQEGIRCWHLARALMAEQGYRIIAPRKARTGQIGQAVHTTPPTPQVPTRARPAGMAGLLEAFGV